MKKLAAGLLCVFAVAAVQAATHTVINTNDLGPGSFRQALLEANLLGVPATIAFNIPGSGTHTITAQSSYPTVTVPLTIDGTTQPGYVSTPVVRIDGSAISGVILDLTAGTSIVKALELKRLTVQLRTAGGNVVTKCVVTDSSTVRSMSGNGNVISSNTFNGPGFRGVWITGGSGASVTGNQFDYYEFAVFMESTSGNSVLNNTFPHCGSLIGPACIGIESNAGSNIVRGNNIINVASDADGIAVFGNANIIGGPNASDGNTVAGGSSSTGINIEGSNNTAEGNTINVSGRGIWVLFQPASNNQILNNKINGAGNGGIRVSAGTGQTIRGNVVTNSGDAVVIESGTNVFEQNYVGVRPDGTSGANRTGVRVRNGRTTITRNSISNSNGTQFPPNVSLGIDLSPDNTVNPNDSGDGDSGPNDLQNYPVLTGAIALGTSTVVTGTLNSTSSSTFTVELFSNSSCSGSGYGEGKTYLGNVTVNTDGSGNASFSKNVTASAGSYITATATNAAGGTSEFSACRQVQSVPPSISSVTPNHGPATGGTAVTITGNGFQPGVTVTFDGTAGMVTSNTQNSINVTTPAHSEGVVDVTVTNPDASSATDRNAYAFTGSRPTITGQPQSATILAGNPITLTVAAAGAAPLSYQWLSGKNPNGLSPIDGAPDASSLTISPAETTWFGVRVSNSSGNARSESAKVTVIDCAAVPTVTPDPPSSHVVMGNGAVLTADFNGATASSIQWYRVTESGNEAIAGGTTSTLMTGPLSATTTFFAIATTECGVITTPQSTVTVVAGRRRAR